MQPLGLLLSLRPYQGATSRSSWGEWGVSTTIFILPLHGPAIVVLHGTPHRLFIYDFGNAQMVQSRDEIIYFSLPNGQVLGPTVPNFIYLKQHNILLLILTF